MPIRKPSGRSIRVAPVMTDRSTPHGCDTLKFRAGSAPACRPFATLTLRPHEETPVTASTSRLEDILEKAGVGVAQMDTTGRYIWVNEPYCRMVGRRRDELLAGQM